MRSLGVLVLVVLGLCAACSAADAASATATLTWAPVTAEPTVTGYAVFRGATTSPVGMTEIGQATGPSFTDPGPLNLSTQYCYAVRAVNALGSGPYSPAACKNTGGLPGAPGAPSVEYTLTP